MIVLHYIGHYLGLDNVSGPWYAFWSGIGLAVFLPYQSWRRHNCHTRWCFRIGRHQARTGDLLCHRCAGKPRHHLRLPHVHNSHR